MLVSGVVPLAFVTFEATQSTVGITLARLWVTYARTQFPSGLFDDWYGERRMILLACLTLLVGNRVLRLGL